MAKLKLGPIVDDKPVKITMELPAALHRDLAAYAEALAPEGDFFIRKAIGWALRDYARWNPQAVRDFVAAMGERLSPLSAREAMRRIA